jgi:glycolate oxidase FAD binding subunit
MATFVKSLPAEEAVAAGVQADVVEVVRAAYEAGEAVYTKGGGTALDYGGGPSRAGRTLELGQLSRVVDYTPRDMTILVEAGVRMADLEATLAAEGQCLPIDVPRAGEATIGGVVATNWCGPRRYGYGTIRDYVIGIHAVDGRGVAFKGGGRVVKNVAGYDFCKLLTGSLGTLGVITQLALKVKPRQECDATIVAECDTWEIADATVARLVNLGPSLVAIDLLVGKAWGGAAPPQSRLAVRLEGTEDEVRWLVERVEAEIGAAGGAIAHRLPDDDAAALWRRLVEFSDSGADPNDDSPFVIQVALPSSAVTRVLTELTAFDADCAILAHAASGIVVARFSKFTQADVSKVLVAELRPLAVKLGGSLVVVRGKLEGLTPHLIWGGRTDAVVLLERVKQKFDPKGILNPGRYIFS